MAHLEKKIGYHQGEQEINNVINYLEFHAQEFPNRTAIRWVDRQDIAKWDGSIESALAHKEITYGQFNELVKQCATGLKELGICKGDRVIIFLPMSVYLYVAMFAVQRIGGVAVFLDSWARRTHLGASAECVGPKAMISHKMAFDLVSQVEEFSSMPLRIVAFEEDASNYSAKLEDLIYGFKADASIEPVTSEFTALITFTTGSSGKPKGANRTHRFLSAQHKALDGVVPYTEKDKDLPAFPIFSLNNLASGVTTVLPAIDLAAPSEKDPIMLANQIINEKMTCATLSPSMLNQLSAYCISNKIKLPSLKRVVTGGAPISKDNVKDFTSIAPNSECWVLYGSTEVEPMAHIEAKEMLSLETDPDPEIVEEGVNVGHISEDLEYKFIKVNKEPIDGKNLNWSDVEVATGEVGEFVVTGDHVCRDYYNNEEAFTKSKILDKEGKVWHRTGDLAYVDSKKYLWMVGRIHNVITRSDKYFFPVRPEVILKRIQGVQRCAFLGMADTNLGEANTVAIQMETGFNETQIIAKEVNRLFEKNNIPVDHIYFVKNIPMDPRHHSKVEYGILRESINNNKDIVQKL